MDIEELGPNGQWRPFKSEEIQLQFIMLDPYYLINLKQEGPNSPTYFAEFRTPDRLGVYKFDVKHWRFGYSFIDQVIEVSNIPFRHDEFARFIPVAFPYYITVFATMAAGFLFIIFFVYSDYNVAPAKGGRQER